MLESYQDKQKIKRDEPSDAVFATVANVYTDGISLIFDGLTTESQKHYKYNKAINFQSNQRVKLFKYAGTYIVEYPI